MRKTTVWVWTHGMTETERQRMTEPSSCCSRFPISVKCDLGVCFPEWIVRMGRNNNDRVIGMAGRRFLSTVVSRSPRAPGRGRPLFVILHLQYVGSFLPNAPKVTIVRSPPYNHTPRQPYLSPSPLTLHTYPPNQPCPPLLQLSSPGPTLHPAWQASPMSTSSTDSITSRPTTGINLRRPTARLVSVPFLRPIILF